MIPLTVIELAWIASHPSFGLVTEALVTATPAATFSAFPKGCTRAVVPPAMVTVSK